MLGQRASTRVVDQVDRFTPDVGGPPQQQPDGDKGNRGCRCGRTKCLKQYCQCFRTDLRCGSWCVCTDCHNDGRHEVERIDAIRKIRMNNATAFKGTDLEIEDQEVRTPRGSLKMIRGCRCKRSKCKKKYCECFGAGLVCTTNCVCVDCENGNDAGNIKVVAAISKTGKEKVRPALRAKEGSKAASKQAQAFRAPAKSPAASSPRMLPSHQSKYPMPVSQPQQYLSQRPAMMQPMQPPMPPMQPPAFGNGPPSSGGKKSFRRNDLRVGVPAPTYVPVPASAGSEVSGTAKAAQAIVTPYGSIHLPPTRSSPRLMSPPMSAAYAPLPGAGLRRDQSSPGMLWGQPSAGRRSASPGMLLREESQWGAEAGFGLQRESSLLMDPYSPLSGELQLPTSRARAPNSAREIDGGLPAGEGSAAGGAVGGFQRRTSSRSRGPPSATGMGPFAGGGFGGIGDVAPLPSPSVDASWGIGIEDPDGILADPGSSRTWAKSLK
jgi:hypothetical protein